MAIDLGTSNTLVYIKGKGVIIDEPSVIAINNKNNQVIAVGEQARVMIGKTPPHITASRPLTAGVISDFESTEEMIKYFVQKVHQENFTLLPRPKIIMSIPLDITEVEKKAVEDVVLQAGASQVMLIEEPIATAIGARLPIQIASANMVVNIGGGVTNIAVISLEGIVAWRSLKIAGEEIDKNIVNYIRDTFNLLLGDIAAENIKKRIGTAFPMKEPMEIKIQGRDIISGLPREVTISSEHIRLAIDRSIKIIVNAIKDTLESTPPELAADIFEQGIYLAGGGALLRDIDKRIAQEIQIPVHVIDDPSTCVIRGMGMVLEDLQNLKSVLTATTREER